MSCINELCIPSTITKFKMATRLFEVGASTLSVIDPYNISNSGQSCGYAYFDGCAGTCMEVITIGGRTHDSLSGITTYTVTGRDVPINSANCDNTPSNILTAGCTHNDNEFVYIGAVTRNFWCDFIACLESNAWDCDKTIACLKAGTHIQIDPDGTITNTWNCTDTVACLKEGTNIQIDPDGTISSTVDCVTIGDCLKALPVLNEVASNPIGIGCDGTTLAKYAPDLEYVVTSVSPLGTFLDTPGGPGWTGGSLGASGFYRLKTFSVGSFDLSALPALCAGERYEATIHTHLDFNYADPNTPLGAYVYGYAGIQLLVNGVPGYSGTNLSAGIYNMGVSGGYWGPTPALSNNFVVTQGVNTITLAVSVSGQSSPSGIDPTVRQHRFIQNQIEIRVRRVKVI